MIGRKKHGLVSNWCLLCGKREDSCKCLNPEYEKRINLTGKGKNNHPTCKPIKLMSYLITLGSVEDGIILDPFVGSGTTCIAAKMLGRRYIGIEISEEYCKIAEGRIASVE